MNLFELRSELITKSHPYKRYSSVIHSILYGMRHWHLRWFSPKCYSFLLFCQNNSMNVIDFLINLLLWPILQLFFGEGEGCCDGVLITAYTERCCRAHISSYVVLVLFLISYEQSVIMHDDGRWWRSNIWTSCLLGNFSNCWCVAFWIKTIWVNSLSHDLRPHRQSVEF